MKSVKQKEVHRGELLKAAGDASGLTVDEIIHRAGYSSRNTYYNHTEQADLPLKTLVRYSKALKVDFTREIEEMKSFIPSEPETEYLETPKSVEEAIKQRDYYVKRYLRAMEEIRKLEEEVKGLRDGKN